MSHHHCGFRVRTGGGVGIGNGDSAKWLAADASRIPWPAGRVTVGPAVYRDARNIPVELEQLLGEHAAEMSPDFLFIVLELQRQHPAAGFTVLLEPGRADLVSIRTTDHLDDTWIVGVVGQLQLEVMQHRLKHEYSVDAQYEAVEFSTARWVTPALEGTEKQEIVKLMAEFRRKCEANLYTDGHEDLVYLAPNRWNLQKAAERFPGIIFEATREHT